jgi:hypothetical protein
MPAPAQEDNHNQDLWNAQDAPEQPMLQRALSTAGDVGIGAGRGAASTASGIDDMVSKIPYVGKWLTTPLAGSKTSEQARADLHRQAIPQNTAQTIGKGLEQTAEFMIPGGAEERLAAKGAELAPKAAPLAKMLASAVGSGAVNKAQGGSFNAGAVAGAGGSALGQGFKAIAPHVAESALNIRKLDRAYGKSGGAIGRSILDETKGFSPGTVAETAQGRLNELNPKLNAMADAASTRMRPRPAGLLPAPAEEVRLHSAPDVAGTPSRPITLTQPDRPMPKMLEGPKRTLPSSSHADIFPEQLPQGSTNIPEQLPGEASGMRADQYVGQIPGERGGPGQPQGVFLRYPQPGRGPIPTTEANNAASLGPARNVLRRAFDTAGRQGERSTANQLAPLATHLGETISGSPIPEDVTPRQLLDLKRGFGNEFIHRWNPETMQGVKGTASQAYHAMGQEFNRTVPGAQELNGRIGRLIPVAKRAESAELNASTAQRVFNRIGAHTGALAGGLFGGYQGYQHGGLPGAFGGAVAGTVLPELLGSPTGEMAIARTLNKTKALRPLTGALLNVPRLNDGTD